MRRTALFLLLAATACHAPQKPDPLTKSLTVNGIKLTVRRDTSWLKGNSSAYEGFRIRVDYPGDRTFNQEQKGLMDFGLEDRFALVQGGDTAKPVFFQRIANGMAHQAEYVAAFQRGDAGAKTLLFADNLFGLGPQVIKW